MRCTARREGKRGEMYEIGREKEGKRWNNEGKGGEDMGTHRKMRGK